MLIIQASGPRCRPTEPKFRLIKDRNYEIKKGENNWTWVKHEKEKKQKRKVLKRQGTNKQER